MADLSKYMIFAGSTLMQPLHDLTVETRDGFFQYPHIPGLLLNREYSMVELPKSFYEIRGGAWHRTNVISPSLRYVEFVMGLATNPGIVQVHDTGTQYSKGGIILPASGAARSVPPKWNMVIGDIDAERVEELQRHWLENPEVAQLIRSYRASLQESFDDFNLQLVLILMRNAAEFAPPSQTEEGRLFDRITGLMNDKSATEICDTLDRAYFRNASQREAELVDPWKRLYENAMGRNFILTPEDIRAFV